MADHKGAAVASNYEAICEENRQRYGTDIGRIGPMLLADRYDDRTHFIFELLQNAEDALSKRGAWSGPRRVTFNLAPDMLSLSHFGRPFDEADVRGVCGIAESTKDQFSIGRFGIGFKSVYTFTDRPEIHSGEEDFAVENYVQPKRLIRTERADDETQIVLPLKPEDATAQDEITNGFKRLEPSALLFLRHIDEINWSVQGGVSGTYLRSSPVALGANVQRVTVIGQESGQSEVDQNWLVCHRNVFTSGQEQVGRVEVAFSLQPVKDQPGHWMVVPVATSPLVVFFPTAVETNLGFLVQGPYKTTPSRDNIPRHELWNKYLVGQTAELLVQAMRWLRGNGMLDVSALRCLPLDREKFPEGSIFEPLFAAARQALLDEPLLPRFDAGYVAASRAKLARTQELRELFSPQQVANLFGAEEAAWLTGDITQDRAPEIRQYVMRELGVTEVTPETIVPRLNQAFLEAQSDDWIANLYEFLSGQPGLRRRLDGVPLVRLSDGRHVVARANGELQAFLPSDIETGFPTVRKAVCASLEARSFLISLGVTEPDLVDDVVLNVLQKYRSDPVDVDDDQYAKDIDRILAAFNTDSKTQREKLLAALRATTFVMVVDGRGGKGYVDRPGNVYIATDRLKLLFAGVPDVMIVDDEYPCLRGEDVRELLEACGALRYPRPVPAPSESYWSDRLKELRVRAGHAETSGYSDSVEDWLLQGFEGLLVHLPQLDPEQRSERARLLWESLGDLEERRGRGIFDGKYTWSHHGKYAATFPSAFVRRLNEAAWVPDASGTLSPPRLVTFDSLGWKTNPFLLTKIEFKPPIIDQLAKEAGIDSAALDLLRRYGITSVAELASRLGITEAPPEPEPEPEPATENEPDEPPSESDVYGDAKDLYGDDMPDIPPGSHDPEGGEGRTGGAGGNGPGAGGAAGGTGGGKTGAGTGGSPKGGRTGGAADGKGRTGDGRGKGGTSPGKGTPGAGGSRPFVSYVGTHPDEEEPDPDGLDQATRMAVESQAIHKIIALEPSLQRAPDGNPGFDLYETDGAGKPIRWVEVKSMTGSLADRPVGLSRTQFDCALEYGAAYWLYVVEHATSADQARVLRIQDPASRALSFTFDKGWASVAMVDPPSD
jgi:hypothetical protein